VNVAISPLVVRLTDFANGFVLADAVRIERLGDLPSGSEIEVLDGSTNIVSGSSSSSLGTSIVSGSVAQRTFTVRNAGPDPLTVQPVIVSGSSDITVSSNFTANQTIAGNGGSASFTINLTTGASGTFSSTLSIPNDETNGDESPFTFDVTATVVPIPAVQIIDDGDSGFSSSGFTSFVGQGRGNDVQFAASGGGSSATWTFTVAPGLFRVSATWSVHANRATNAPYTLLDGTTSLATVNVNQQAAPNDRTDAGSVWEDLGAQYAVTGNTLTVRLTSGTSGYVIADGIRIERIGDLPASLEPCSDRPMATRIGRGRSRGGFEIRTPFADNPFAEVAETRRCGWRNSRGENTDETFRNLAQLVVTFSECGCPRRDAGRGCIRRGTGQARLELRTGVVAAVLAGGHGRRRVSLVPQRVGDGGGASGGAVSRAAGAGRPQLGGRRDLRRGARLRLDA
jgi:hypothetical protein